MRRLIPILAVLALAGCGGSHPHASSSSASTSTGGTITASPAPATNCPPGQSFMGCAAGAAATFTGQPPAGVSPRTSVAGVKFPDVSSFQGCSIDWARIPVPGAVVKASEFTQDPCFEHNVASLKAAHKLWSPYLFVRSCSAARFIASIRSVGGLTSLPAVIDEEVPAANNCTASLAFQIHAAFGRWPVEYTSPGTETAGAGAGHLALWIADFGPSFPCLWTCQPVAWQFASPPFVFFNIPGLGFVDVNADRGFLKLTPRPVDLEHYERIPDTRWRLSGQTVRERNTIMTWDRRGCRNPTQREVCKSTHAHLVLLYGRDEHVYAHASKAKRERYYLGARVLGIYRRAFERPGVVTHWL